MKLPVGGLTLDRLVVDYAVTLGLSDGSELRIETEFQLGTAEGTVRELEPSRLDAASVQELAALQDDKIINAHADGDGTLRMSLGTGVQFRISPNESYEAWTFANPSGLKVVALPGGGLATWGAT